MELEIIIDSQLEFERLRKLAPLAKISGLEFQYRDCEDYLKPIFKQYERSGDAPEPGRETPALSDFIAYRHAQQGASFGAFADSTRKAVEKLHEALLEPIDLGDEVEPSSGVTPSKS